MSRLENQKNYRVILEPNELGGFTVTVPALPGCITQGKNREEALERVREAIACHLEGLIAAGLPLIEDTTEEARVMVGA